MEISAVEGRGLFRHARTCAQVIRRDEVSGAPTLLYKVLVDRGVSWPHACQLLADMQAAAAQQQRRSKQARQSPPCLLLLPDMLAGG